jgi:hypothetical protein
VGGRGGFEEEVEDGCGRLTDEAAAAPSKRRRSQKRDKAATNNDDDIAVIIRIHPTCTAGGGEGHVNLYNFATLRFCDRTQKQF